MLRDTGENFFADVSGECFGQEIADGGEGGGHKRENFVDQGIGVAEAGLLRDGGPMARADVFEFPKGRWWPGRPGRGTLLAKRVGCGPGR